MMCHLFVLPLFIGICLQFICYQTLANTSLNLSESTIALLDDSILPIATTLINGYNGTSVDSTSTSSSSSTSVGYPPFFSDDDDEYGKYKFK